MTDLIEAIAAGPCPLPVALVVAHPDDETLALGSRFRDLPRLRLIHLTDGAPRAPGDARRAGFADAADYAAAREAELVRALAALGAGAVERRRYGYPDQAAIDHVEAIVERLTADLAGTAAVVTHAYEHGHPDHDTAALAVALACARMGDDAPVRIEFAGYHLGEAGPVFGRFRDDPTCPERVIPLGPAARARKAAALACFATQAATLAPFPLDAERLRLAPVYDFTQAPGPALYERWGFSIRAADWRAKAAAACARAGRSPCAG